ncbi:hypothetical protein BD289DRAFT_456377 [Coniella lustricola]|uniref:Ecp2 effector protein-like domain-containing protein n=1 Tax=Coniella lustricola TaxID=2025994 RepID=A0A2T2ZW49_9PEZI|nr:hypothetical protein BD289DRAFT_456377 [Coniella lustricola]
MHLFNKSLLLTVALNASFLVPIIDAFRLQPSYQRLRDFAPTGIAFIRTNGTNVECQITTMVELAGEGEITMRDCYHMMKSFKHEGHYLMKASGWQSSIGYPYWAEGSCVFGFTRIDDGTEAVFFGDGDFIKLLASSIDMQPDVKYMQPVKGTALCNTSGDVAAQIEWNVHLALRNSPDKRL